MFGTMKKAMVVAAIAGISALAPSMASADTWKVGGVDYTGTARAHGTLTLTAGSGATTTCTVTGTLNLNNGGTAPNQAQGSVTSFLLGIPTGVGGFCSTSLPNCAVTATANTSTPWTVSTNGTNATIAGILFQNIYTNSGGTCALNGVPVNASGSLTGAVTGPTFDTLVLNNAGPLTTTVGNATVSGSVTLADTSGNPVELG